MAPIEAPRFEVGRNLLRSDFNGVYTHPKIEFGAVLAGTGTIVYNGRRYAMQEDAVYFIDMRVPHCHHRGSQPLDYVYAGLPYDVLQALVPHDCFFPLIKPFLLVQSGHLSPVIDRGRIVRDLLVGACEKYAAGTAYEYVEAWAYVIRALAEIGRRCDERARRAKGVRWDIPESLTRALHFLGQHYAEPLRVEAIARECNLSPSRMTHLFAQFLHVPPIAYRNNLRISLAERRLLSSGDKIDRIALECGFQNLSLFRRLVRRKTGKSPAQLRAAAG